jgi:hypothetical protein
MTKKEFISEVKSIAGEMKKDHPELRKGQAIFNVVDRNFNNIARIVQFDYDVDCFYDDSMIEPFLDKCYELFDKMNKTK